MAITMTGLACFFVQAYSGLHRPCSSQQYLNCYVCGCLVCDFSAVPHSKVHGLLDVPLQYLQKVWIISEQNGLLEIHHYVKILVLSQLGQNVGRGKVWLAVLKYLLPQISN
jgi:hypothetical protein